MQHVKYQPVFKGVLNIDEYYNKQILAKKMYMDNAQVDLKDIFRALSVTILCF